MNYFITGGTGFIGRFLVALLLKHSDAKVFALVRSGSNYKIEALRRRLGVDDDRLVAINGDLTRPHLGLIKRDREDLSGQIDHFFHLAAVYDLDASEEAHDKTNITGTTYAVALAEELKSGCFHFLGSVAAAGQYKGTFYEDMFEEAGPLVNPYLRTKHEAEAIVRNRCNIPYRIYRPSLVVGHSQTGEIDKVDGPYYFFKLIQHLGELLPPWIPLLGFEGGRLNIVPVDYVAQALDFLAHQPGLDGQCFHLTADKDYSVGELMNIFASVADAPKAPVRIGLDVVDNVPKMIRNGVSHMPPARYALHQALESLEVPEEALRFMAWPTRFDNRRANELLQPANIEAPELETYAQALWDYWANHLDPDRDEKKRLRDSEPSQRIAKAVTDKVVLITGATSGIGKAAALKLAKAGATVLLVARTVEKLEQTLHEIEKLGGTAIAYPCDVSNLDDVDRLVQKVSEEHDRIDVLVNNAGRSIRRSVLHTIGRFHDFERTMQLNYFGALRLIMGLLPGMVARGDGQIINISSIGVLTNAPRFSAYVASKAALDAFSRCAGSELAHQGIHFTTINMPLVRTPMIAPTKLYNHVPTISPNQAADMICNAIVRRPKRIATGLGIFGQIMHFITPQVTETIMNTGFKLFSDSAASMGGKESTPKRISREQAAFTRLFKGIHW